MTVQRGMRIRGQLVEHVAHQDQRFMGVQSDGSAAGIDNDDPPVPELGIDGG